MNREKFRVLVKLCIAEVLRDLLTQKEVSTSASAGPYMIPQAFQSGDKDKNLRRKHAQAAGMTVIAPMDEAEKPKKYKRGSKRFYTDKQNKKLDLKKEARAPTPDEQSKINASAKKESKSLPIVKKQLGEKSPPGWSGTTKAMKKHKNIDNPFALAWWMKNKGDKPHHKPEK